MSGIVQNFRIIRVSEMSSNYNVAQLKATFSYWGKEGAGARERVE